MLLLNPNPESLKKIKQPLNPSHILSLIFNDNKAQNMYKNLYFGVEMS